MVRQDNVEVTLVTGYAACVTFAFNSATGHARLQSPRESACKAFYHLDPVRSDPSAGKILITH